MNGDPWRYRCPHGDTGWQSRVKSNGADNAPESQYYCKTCQKNGRDPHFDELVDIKEPAQHHIDDPGVTAV
jgi:hypothetical protein